MLSLLSFLMNEHLCYILGRKQKGKVGIFCQIKFFFLKVFEAICDVVDLLIIETLQRDLGPVKALD